MNVFKVRCSDLVEWVEVVVVGRGAGEEGGKRGGRGLGGREGRVRGSVGVEGGREKEEEEGGAGREGAFRGVAGLPSGSHKRKKGESETFRVPTHRHTHTHPHTIVCPGVCCVRSRQRVE